MTTYTGPLPMGLSQDMADRMARVAKVCGHDQSVVPVLYGMMIGATADDLDAAAHAYLGMTWNEVADRLEADGEGPLPRKPC